MTDGSHGETSNLKTDRVQKRNTAFVQMIRSHESEIVRTSEACPDQKGVADR